MVYHYIINITNPTIAFVIPLTVPVNVGLAKFAFKFNAVCCVVDTGLFASDIIYITQTNHYFCYSTYCTSKAGLAKFAFKFNAANCALDTGLLASLVYQHLLN
jgi:hypothetical protein